MGTVSHKLRFASVCLCAACLLSHLFVTFEQENNKLQIQRNRGLLECLKTLNTYRLLNDHTVGFWCLQSKMRPKNII